MVRYNKLALERLTDFTHRITEFFNNSKKEEETVAVPFHICAKKLKHDCSFMYQGSKLVGDSTLPYFCSKQEHIDIYLSSGAKPFTCEGCEFYNKEK